MGLLLAVVVHPADIQDRDGARLVMQRLVGRLPGLQLIWADGAYGGKLVAWAQRIAGWSLELVRRLASAKRDSRSRSAAFSAASSSVCFIALTA